MCVIEEGIEGGIEGGMAVEVDDKVEVLLSPKSWLGGGVDG